MTTRPQLSGEALTWPTASSLRGEGQQGVQVVEASGHDALLCVAEVEGVAELVEDTAHSGGHAAPHRASVAAVVHVEGGVHGRAVTQTPRHSRDGGWPRPQTARAEESEASASQSHVTSRHLEGRAVRHWLDPPWVKVPCGGQEGDVLHPPVPDARAE